MAVPAFLAAAASRLKGAGAVGLLRGFLGVPIIGTAAATGLAVFFIGAMITHVHAQVYYNIAFRCLPCICFDRVRQRICLGSRCRAFECDVGTGDWTVHVRGIVIAI
ncbi:MAG TPA: DoxX family protein [bacterium]|nr:DoxX family protein [bacterium]